MKPTVAADEMFPEGVGPYMDLEEGRLPHGTTFQFGEDLMSLFGATHRTPQKLTANHRRLKHLLSIDAGGPSNLLMDLAANEKAVHADFFNDFEDLFDDDDLK